MSRKICRKTHALITFNILLFMITFGKRAVVVFAVDLKQGYKYIRKNTDKKFEKQKEKFLNSTSSFLSFLETSRSKTR